MSTDTLTVYHGTTSLIDVIDVLKGKPYKDFGRGFYVTQDINHAKSLAIRNKAIEKERLGKVVPAYIYTYTLDLSHTKKFNTKIFNEANPFKVKRHRASVPPTITQSKKSCLIRRAPTIIAFAAEEHAVLIVLT